MYNALHMYVTNSIKTSRVCIQTEIHFIAPAYNYSTLNNYAYSFPFPEHFCQSHKYVVDEMVPIEDSKSAVGT